MHRSRKAAAQTTWRRLDVYIMLVLRCDRCGRSHVASSQCDGDCKHSPVLQRVFIWRSELNDLCSAKRKKTSESARLCSRQPIVFTARCYASAEGLLAMGLCLSVSACVRVRLSVTSRSSTKTAKCRITQTTPHDTPDVDVYCDKLHFHACQSNVDRRKYCQL